jgi:histidyl-tRNA synthetase
VETALVINDLMQALGFERFAIRINNRKILNGLLQKFGLRQFGPAVLRGIDKLPKIGRDSVRQEILDSTSLAPDLVDRILALAEVRGSNQQMLGGLSTFCGGDDLATTGLNELHQIVSSCKAVGLVEPRLRIDPSIARGLDYYTGTIYETFLDDLPEIGSVCSGGRYDNLAELFTKQQLPGIGASLGLDRLLAAMETLSLLPQQRATAEVMVVQFSAGLLDRYLQIASNLRRRRVAVEVYPEAKKLNTQFKYADRRGFAAVIIAGEEEFLSAHVQVKWMADGSQSKIPLDANCDHLAKWLTDRLSNNQ